MEENKIPETPEPNIPLREDGTPKVRFQAGVRPGPNGRVEKAIFINGEKLDWSVDYNAFAEAKKMGPMYVQEMQKDIIRHYIASVSEVLGRHVTIEEIKSAITTGWI